MPVPRLGFMLLHLSCDQGRATHHMSRVVLELSLTISCTLTLAEKVRMVEVSLLGEEEAEKVDEDVQVSRFELVKCSHPQLILDCVIS